MQSGPITTNDISSNPAHGEVYLIQHYVMKFISDFCKGGGYLRVIRFPYTNKTDRYDKTEILFKVALNFIPLTPILK